VRRSRVFSISGSGSGRFVSCPRVRMRSERRRRWGVIRFYGFVSRRVAMLRCNTSTSSSGISNRSCSYWIR
jgi:hypothetical protein